VETTNLISQDSVYKNWLKDLKNRFRQVQLKAIVKVNSELLNFYWELGKEITEKQKFSNWGDGFLQQLSIDLMTEFPAIKGFSLRNLKYMRQWFNFWNGKNALVQQAVAQNENGQQAVAQLTKIPWGHNIAIISKCKNHEEAVFYVKNTISQNWSRSVLVHQIEGKLFERKGKAIHNFEVTLPKPQSDLAQQTLKDPYIFDFISLTDNYNERELEKELINHITHFLLELGAGFAFLGKQVQINVGKREFFLDLLFYHTRLHAYVVVELKTGDFEPEYAGKLNFYLKAVDTQLKKENDNNSIGILLCKNKEKTIVEYALSDINKPIGVSEYQLVSSLPENLKSSLPSIEELENELDTLNI